MNHYSCHWFLLPGHLRRWGRTEKMHLPCGQKVPIALYTFKSLHSARWRNDRESSLYFLSAYGSCPRKGRVQFWKYSTVLSISLSDFLMLLHPLSSSQNNVTNWRSSYAQAHLPMCCCVVLVYEQSTPCILTPRWQCFPTVALSGQLCLSPWVQCLGLTWPTGSFMSLLPGWAGRATVLFWHTILWQLILYELYAMPSLMCHA